MTESKIALVTAVLAMSAASFTGVANAATAHNLQSGAQTSNTYDTAASAVAKQHR